MQQVAAPSGFPKCPEKEQKAKPRADYGHPADEGRTVICIGLNQMNIGAGPVQQLGQLPRLVGHAACGRRQGSDQPDAQALEAGRSRAHGRRRAASRSKTGR